jgi:hypothetical protein
MLVEGDEAILRALHHHPQPGDAVRLLAPGGTVVDAIAFRPLAPSASYIQGEDGTWHTDWPPSPGEAQPASSSA